MTTATHIDSKTMAPRFFLAAIFLFALYTGIPAVVSGILIPPPLMGASGFALLYLNRTGLDRVRLSVLAMAGFLVVICIIAPSPVGLLSDRLKSLMLSLYGITAALGFALEVVRWDSDARRAFLLWALGLTLVGVLLEVYTPFSNISDAFREAVYSPERLYTADFRDVSMHGSVRPKLFGNEPSYLALFSGYLVFMGAIVSRSLWQYAYVGASFVLLAVLVGSPILYVLPALPCLWFLFGRGLLSGRTFCAAIGGTLVVYLVADNWQQLLYGEFSGSGRLAGIVTGTDMSTALRFVVPMRLADKALAAYPLFGVGLGGKSILSSDAFDILAATHSPLVLRLSEDQFFGCAFFLIPTYFGYIGTVIFLWLLGQLSKSFSYARASQVLAISLVMWTVTPFNTWFWGYFFTLIAFVKPHGSAPYPRPATEIEFGTGSSELGLPLVSKAPS